MADDIGLPILAQDPCLWWWLDGETVGRMEAQ